jgi:hypothetical protein
MKKVLINGKIVAEKDTVTKLNFRSPTPQWATLIFNIVAAFSGIMGLIMVTFADEIPDKTEILIGKIIIVGLPALRILTKSLGVEVKEHK